MSSKVRDPFISPIRQSSGSLIVFQLNHGRMPVFASPGLVTAWRKQHTDHVDGERVHVVVDRVKVRGQRLVAERTGGRFE